MGTEGYRSAVGNEAFGVQRSVQMADGTGHCIRYGWMAVMMLKYDGGRLGGLGMDEGDAGELLEEGRGGYA